MLKMVESKWLKSRGKHQAVVRKQNPVKENYSGG